MPCQWTPIGVKLRPPAAVALHQLARHRSARTGEWVTMPSLVRDAVEQYLAANQEEVAVALAVIEQEGR